MTSKHPFTAEHRRMNARSRMWQFLLDELHAIEANDETAMAIAAQLKWLSERQAYDMREACHRR